MKISELHRKYADALDLCEKNNICYTNAVRLYKNELNSRPLFIEDPKEYSFPVAIVEGKPVFIGDELFNAFGEKMKVFDVQDPKALSENYSWSLPKPKTFMLNGVEFDMPEKYCTLNNGYGANILGSIYYFKSLGEYNKLRKLIGNILTENKPLPRLNAEVI